MQDYKTLKEEAAKYIRYEKDRKNRIAYLTFDRVDALNAANIGMRQNYADLIHKANADDEAMWTWWFPRMTRCSATRRFAMPVGDRRR
jgi:hypothetical protein